MYNRFEINKDIFLNNLEKIMMRIAYFKKVGYKQVYHLIVPNLEKEKIKELYKSPYLSQGIKIYNRYITVDENSRPKDYSNIDYIKEIKGLPTQELIDMYYLQCIGGYSSHYPTTNFIVQLDEKMNMYINNEKIGNFFEEIKVPNIKNFYLGIKKCKTCLNCMCDISKTKGMIFLIDPEECKYKAKLKSLVSKEVVEVTREEYATLMEAMAQVLRETSISHDIIIETLQGGIDG